MLKEKTAKIKMIKELGYDHKDEFLFLLEEYNRYLSRHLNPYIKPSHPSHVPNITIAN